MIEFFKVARLAEIPAEGSKVVFFMQKEIAIFRHSNCVYAIDNLCPHRQVALSTGAVEDGIVTCPWHGARFELKTGKGLAGPHQTDIGCYPVKISSGDIMLGTRS